MADSMTDAVSQAAAPAYAGEGAGINKVVIAALVLWLCVGIALLGIILFGGYEGQPVDDPSALAFTEHHTLAGPLLLFWFAFSTIAVPRALQFVARDRA